MIKKWEITFILLCWISGLSCSEQESYQDTPVSGNILILADESYQPMIRAQLDTFHQLYQYAHIEVRFLPEAQVFQEFMSNDTVRLAITARSLNAAENETFVQRKIIPRETRIAVDALAFVLNKNNPDTMITFDQLKGIVTGNLTTWNQLGTNSPKDSIQVVFDRNGSSTTRYLKEKFLSSDSLPHNWFAIESNEKLIDYVGSSPRAIGVIAVNWISDKDDPETNRFLDKVNVVELAPPDTSSTEKTEYYKPYQAYIALKKYPLTRDVVIISKEGRNGLGTGFAAFVAGDQGQRLVRLMGMLPATMPVRIVKIN